MVGIRSTKACRVSDIGEHLKRARQNRRLSLSAVASELRIPFSQLQALEAGDVSVFAAEVYARGVFTKYRHYLGLEGENVSDQAFMRALAGGREVVPLKVPTPASWFVHFVTPARLLLGLGLCVMLVIGSYLAWQVQSFLRLPHLAVLSPRVTVMKNDTVEVRGQAAQSATVTVNSQPVLLQPNGDFALTLTLHPGVNVVEVEAMNAAGRTNRVEKDLLVPRS
ncbi:MAG TPA: helix-turn-helix domain-containing protein [Verrucomicrobiae bacterium]|nr:helix-turn-helix domain-containing protein [Verrucomicrobiae bacterium]